MSEREQKREPSFILRSNTISGALTLLALVGTVIAVYAYFPLRDNELMTRATELARERPALDLASPTDGELRAWSIGALGASVPWPKAGVHLEILGAASVEVQHKRAGLVRYRAGGDEVTMVAQRARDPAPRKHRRVDGVVLVVSWRAGKWTMVAVGPAQTASRWQPLVGAP